MRIYYYTFNSMGVIAAVFFILAVIIGVVTGGAHSVVEFIEKYYVIIGIVLFVIITAISVSFYIDNPLSIGFRIVNGIATEIALIQSGVFLVYGVYRTLQMYPKNAFLILGTFAIFVVLFLIDLAVTFFVITMTMEKKWGFIPMLLIAAIGLWIAIS